MSLEKLSSQLAELTTGKTKKLPPIELWDPPYCGEIDLKIKPNGDWYFGGTIFKRLSLVKLFASVLLRDLSEDHDDYYLVTPVEKIKIMVEDAPFVLTQWAWQDDSQTNMVVSTNLDDEFTLDVSHPILVTGEAELYVTVRRNLQARVHRNVYYQWVALAQEKKTSQGTEVIFSSAGVDFSLGLIGQ